uniref:Uncharacterized protein n=1 Tax=Chromera velia CCMP2878 TaxID=1169474 RepID=A0A0G4I9G6_9ALVE|eukprot:Cvel_12151.t1-p1 / transcript=Cvel_12151.t1 / gene=Cvel_12151 / organism=Chromera_velia_CCMP2878 / gene_product=Calcium-activated potassium channel slo-1, putative / transcript_product=Calcium-activated potassium channel slo-1, putative / location=Cvel_scaffold783:36241-49909(-) / protein_length=1388 / sequence_SO=supercontig / SO=protein_coding / is_pseudo=false
MKPDIAIKTRRWSEAVVASILFCGALGSLIYLNIQTYQRHWENQLLSWAHALAFMFGSQILSAISLVFFTTSFREEIFLPADLVRLLTVQICGCCARRKNYQKSAAESRTALWKSLEALWTTVEPVYHFSRVLRTLIWAVYWGYATQFWVRDNGQDPEWNFRNFSEDPDRIFDTLERAYLTCITLDFLVDVVVSPKIWTQIISFGFLACSRLPAIFSGPYATKIFPFVSPDALSLLNSVAVLLTTLFGYASLMWVLEGLKLEGGTGNSLVGRSVPDYIYFSVVTVSTIGYGDISPQTIFGKWVTVGFILFVLFRLPDELNKLASLLSAPPRAIGKKPGVRDCARFLLLVGKVTPKQVYVFVEEVVNYADIKPEKVVLLTPSSPTDFREVVSTLNDRMGVSLRVRQGDAGDEGSLEDLNVVNAQYARVIFVFSDIASPYPDREDRKTILRVLGIRKFFLSEGLSGTSMDNVVVQLNQPGPMANQAYALGVHSVITFNAVKMSLLAREAQGCAGLTTVVRNLTRSMAALRVEEDEVTEEEIAGAFDQNVMEEEGTRVLTAGLYRFGSTFEIYKTRCPSWAVGQSFEDVTFAALAAPVRIILVGLIRHVAQDSDEYGDRTAARLQRTNTSAMISKGNDTNGMRGSNTEETEEKAGASFVHLNPVGMTLRHSDFLIVIARERKDSALFSTSSLSDMGPEKGRDQRRTRAIECGQAVEREKKKQQQGGERGQSVRIHTGDTQVDRKGPTGPQYVPVGQHEAPPPPVAPASSSNAGYCLAFCAAPVDLRNAEMERDEEPVDCEALEAGALLHHHAGAPSEEGGDPFGDCSPSPSGTSLDGGNSSADFFRGASQGVLESREAQKVHGETRAEDREAVQRLEEGTHLQKPLTAEALTHSAAEPPPPHQQQAEEDENQNPSETTRRLLFNNERQASVEGKRETYTPRKDSTGIALTGDELMIRKEGEWRARMQVDSIEEAREYWKQCGTDPNLPFVLALFWPTALDLWLESFANFKKKSNSDLNVVVLCPKLPVKFDEWAPLTNYRHFVAFIEANPMDEGALAMAGVLDPLLNGVIVFQGSKAVEFTLFAGDSDVSVVLAKLKAQSILKSIRKGPDSDPPKDIANNKGLWKIHVVGELMDIKNLRFFDNSRWWPLDSTQEDGGGEEMESAYLHSVAYAAGQVFANDFLFGLVCNSGKICTSMVDTLLRDRIRPKKVPPSSPQAKGGAGRPASMKLPLGQSHMSSVGGNKFPSLFEMRNARDVALEFMGESPSTCIELWALPPSFEGKQFGDLQDWALVERKVIVLGLYRADQFITDEILPSPGTAGTAGLGKKKSMGLILGDFGAETRRRNSTCTAPPRGTVLLDTDRVYVIPPGPSRPPPLSEEDAGELLIAQMPW